MELVIITTDSIYVRFVWSFAIIRTMKRKALAKYKKQKTLMNKVIYLAAFIEPLFLLPQIVQIYRMHDAASISLLTWVGFNVLTAVWVWWAVLNKERVVLVYQGLYLFFNTIVIGEAIMYGAHWV
jgi:uncharacterized protein with PQ loop repeat